MCLIKITWLTLFAYKERMIGMKIRILIFSFMMLMILYPTNLFCAEGTILTNAGGNLNTGSYYLNSNITLINNIVIPEGKNVTLDLNGYVLKGKGNGSVITNNGILVIEDTRTVNGETNHGKITNGNSENGRRYM